MSLYAPSLVHGGEWKFGTGVGADLTATNNVFLAPAGQETRDLVLGVTPSFSASLDAAAAEAVKRWHFVPARRGTEAVEAWVRVPIEFRLEDAL